MPLSEETKRQIELLMSDSMDRHIGVSRNVNVDRNVDNVTNTDNSAITETITNSDDYRLASINDRMEMNRRREFHSRHRNNLLDLLNPDRDVDVDIIPDDQLNEVRPTCSVNEESIIAPSSFDVIFNPYVCKKSDIVDSFMPKTVIDVITSRSHMEVDSNGLPIPLYISRMVSDASSYEILDVNGNRVSYVTSPSV